MSVHVIHSKKHGDIEVIVDDCDDYLFHEYTWCIAKLRHNCFIAQRKFVDDDGISHTMYLHRMIMNARSNDIADHINGDAVDNRRANLRFATKAGNGQNSRRRKDNTSGYKGVCRTKTGRWTAHIQLGTFSTKEEAAHEYDRAAKSFFGEFACINFPKDE